MSVSSTFNSSESSLHLLHEYCFESRLGNFIFTAFFVAKIFLLPLFILVLYVGHQRWRQQRSVSAAATMSHTDIFTYNMVALELISVLGCCFYCCGALTDIQSIIRVGTDMFSVTSPGQTLFHLLTCVERYLAVVHPITYLGLRQSGGVRIRNISIGCVWLLCFGLLGLNNVLTKDLTSIAGSCLLVFCLVVFSFCSLAVLWVLIHPGPGEVGGDREHVDQTKQRAFHTITAIMGALFLRFVAILVASVMYASVLTHRCVVGSSSVWLTLPGSLVLPLLFLHRAGKLPGCKHNTQSG